MSSRWPGRLHGARRIRAYGRRRHSRGLWMARLSPRTRSGSMSRARRPTGCAWCSICTSPRLLCSARQSLAQSPHSKCFPRASFLRAHRAQRLLLHRRFCGSTNRTHHPLWTPPRRHPSMRRSRAHCCMAMSLGHGPRSKSCGLQAPLPTYPSTCGMPPGRSPPKARPVPHRPTRCIRGWTGCASGYVSCGTCVLLSLCTTTSGCCTSC